MRALVAVPSRRRVRRRPLRSRRERPYRRAKKAERTGDWRKALQEWKGAYAAEANAEYLIGIGDALFQLGDKAEAKNNYEAYLTDPLALPANVDKVKKKLAPAERLGSGTLALPTSAPPAAAPSLPLPNVAATRRLTRCKKAQNKSAASWLDLPAPGRRRARETASADKPACSSLASPQLAGEEGAGEGCASAAPPLPLPLPGAPAKAETRKSRHQPSRPRSRRRPSPSRWWRRPRRTRLPSRQSSAALFPREPQGRSGGVQRRWRMSPRVSRSPPPAAAFWRSRKRAPRTTI